MINALVVDDEKLARQGFIAMTDWNAFGIRIVGEAKDGYTALSMLEEQNIDLMFVDITMPGISGFELMRRAQRRFPAVKFVILTCHHEFDYIQEALRIGAIDYIVKTLLNKANVEETMERIRTRLAREAARQAAEEAGFRGAVACFGRGAGGRESGGYLPESWGFVPLQPDIRISWCGEPGLPDWASALRERVPSGWQTVYIAPSGRYSKKDAEQLLAETLEHYLFYAADDNGPEEVKLEELAELRNGGREGGDSGADAVQEWNKMKWLLYGKEWKLLVDKLENGRMAPVRLTRMAEELARDWRTYLDWEADERESLLANRPLRSWREVRTMLSDMALAVQRRAADLSLSRDVAVCLLQALAYMKEQACRNLNQADVAKQVGMSRSYFSQCFKRFAGVSFGDMLRSMRIHHAKSLLLESELSVHEIAGIVGFDDHKHFSRTFRERVGLYPTEYRSLQQLQEGGGT